MKKILNIILILFLLTSCAQVNEPPIKKQNTFNFSALKVAPNEVKEFKSFKQILTQSNLEKRFRMPTYDFVDSISITGWDNNHTNDVRTAFYEGYYDAIYFDFMGILRNAIKVSDPAYMSGAITPVIEFQEGYEALIHSYVTPVDYMSLQVLTPGGQHYVEGLENFLVVQAAGSNDFVHVNKYLPVDQLTGNHFVTGTGTTINTTGYWIEFFDIDPIYNRYSSFSNGYIAGEIIAIYNTALIYDKDINWKKVKAAVIKTSTYHGVWDEYNGYGKIRPLNALWELFKTRFR